MSLTQHYHYYFESEFYAKEPPLIFYIDPVHGPNRVGFVMNWAARVQAREVGTDFVLDFEEDKFGGVVARVVENL